MEFTYQNKTYHTIFELAKDMYLFGEDFKRDFKTNNDFFAFVDSQSPEKAERLENLTRQMLNNDVLLFKASYLLNPYMTFRFNGREFKDWSLMGKKMMEKSPNTIPYYEEILRFSLLSHQMESSEENKRNPSLYQDILDIENDAKNDLAFAYFELAYLLSGKNTLIYQGVEYENLFNFTYYMQKSESHGLTDKEMEVLLPVLRAYEKYGNDHNMTAMFLHIVSERDKAKNKLKETIERKEEEIRKLL